MSMKSLLLAMTLLASPLSVQLATAAEKPKLAPLPFHKTAFWDTGARLTIVLATPVQ